MRSRVSRVYRVEEKKKGARECRLYTVNPMLEKRKVRDKLIERKHIEDIVVQV